MKVEITHSEINKFHNCQLIQFYPEFKKIVAFNYTSLQYAKALVDNYSIGIWKIKTIK